MSGASGARAPAPVPLETAAPVRPAAQPGRMLRRSGWIAVPVVVLVIASAVFFTRREQPIYRASTMLVVGPTSLVQGTGDILRGLETLERRTVLATFARIPMAPEAQAAAATELQVEPAALDAFAVAASVVPSTNIIRIDVDGPDPARAAELANVLAGITRDEARSFYRIFTMRALSAARAASRPVHPDPRRNYTVAVILGLFLSGLAVFALDRLRQIPGA